MLKEDKKNFDIQFENEYVTRKEAAQFLRISLAKLDLTKDIDRIKFGKSVRFSLATLREYAINHTIKGVEDV